MNNERSLSKEITEGFEALKSMRNNEPVAWMLADKEAEHIRSIIAVQHDFVPEGCVEIPLYTHPVKELTDEEIAEEWAKFYPDVFHTHLIDFARAILRKAQEK
jgi:hypothetical protein